MYQALRGPQTSNGYLVGFEGFELDPCQDTLEKVYTYEEEDTCVSFEEEETDLSLAVSTPS